MSSSGVQITGQVKPAARQVLSISGNNLALLMWRQFHVSMKSIPC